MEKEKKDDHTKFSKGYRKYIRRRKSEIRKSNINPDEQAKMIEDLYKKE